jgi:hypothetical protein
MSVFEIDRKAQGTPQPFSEPPTIARAALPKLDEVLSELDRLRARQTQLFFEVERLRAGLPAARQLDRGALAAAAAGGEQSPPLAAAAAEVMIEDVNRQAVALVDLIDQEQERVNRTITRQRDSWGKDLKQGIEEAVGEYGAAILNVERARAALVDRITAASWLAYHPDQGPVPPLHYIPQPPELADQPKPSAAHVLNYLRRDAENLPTMGAIRVGDDPAKIIDGFIDRHGWFFAKEGGRRQWMHGRTLGAWDAQDRIAQIEASIKPNDAA